MKKLISCLAVVLTSSSLWAGATFSRAHNWVDQEVLTAADLNAEFNNILNNLDPAGMDDYSLTLSQMQTTVDPYPAAVESLATDLKGEIERLRYQILQLKKSIQTIDSTYWYQDTPGQGTFTIKTSSVGVNNTSPAAALDVIGNTKITGNLDVTGALTLVPPSSVVTACKSAIQTITVAGGVQQITFPVELTDRNSDFSGSDFTVPTTGYYAVFGEVIWVATAAVSTSFSVHLYNGPTQICKNVSSRTATEALFGDTETLVYFGSFTAGTTLSLRGEAIGNDVYLPYYGANVNRFCIMRIQ